MSKVDLKLRTIDEILEEALKLNNSQKGIIASMHEAPTPEMAYSVLTGARNAVTERKALERNGYISVDDQNKRAVLTDSGKAVLTSENLADETGELTDRGQELVKRYNGDKKEWQAFESFKYFI